MAEKDSSGGVVECVIEGLPAGIGEPVFEKLDANLAKAILSIGAVKGFEIGSDLARRPCGARRTMMPLQLRGGGAPPRLR